MTPEQISLVESSLAGIQDDELDAVAKDFYERLFEADPSTAPMFHSDPASQRRKFAAELEQILLSIKEHRAFLTRARELGARHRHYGVRSAHYRTVGIALLAAFECRLGQRWTDELAQAWRLAYNLTAEAMMAGAADAAPAGSPGAD